MLNGRTRNVICLTGCARSHLAYHLLRGEEEKAEQMLGLWVDLYGRDNVYVELQNHRRGFDDSLNARLCALARRFGLKVVATNNVHTLGRGDFWIHEALACWRAGRLSRSAVFPDRPRSAEVYLKGADEMAALFRERPDALVNTLEIAERCSPVLDPAVRRWPDYTALPPGHSEETYLEHLVGVGARARFGPHLSESVRRRIQYELRLIRDKGFAGYFLLVWDICRWMRRQDILYRIRGSAGGSVVAYCLYIGTINPFEYNLSFDRFLNEARSAAPDIDLDIDSRERDRVVARLRDVFGRDRVASVAAYSTVRGKSLIRDFGPVFDIPPDAVDIASKSLRNVGAHNLGEAFENLPQLRDAGLPKEPFEPLIHLGRAISRFPSHNQTTVGVVVSGLPLTRVSPLWPAAKDGEAAVSYDKDWVEKVGLIKTDFLFLRELAAIRDCVKSINEEALTPVPSPQGRGEKDTETRRRADAEVFFSSPSGGGREGAGTETVNEERGAIDAESGRSSHPETLPQPLPRGGENIISSPSWGGREGAGTETVNDGRGAIDAESGRSSLPETLPQPLPRGGEIIISSPFGGGREGAGTETVNDGRGAIDAESGRSSLPETLPQPLPRGGENTISSPSGGGREGADSFDYDRIPLNDPDTFALLQSGRTIGVFQLESPAQRVLMQRMKPRHISDCVAAVALIRPGPISGDAVNPFVRRRTGREPVTYPDERLKPVLEDTLGVVIYQDQVIELAIAAAGWSPDRADALRRKISHARSKDRMREIEEEFTAAVIANGFTPETARWCFTSIMGFASYGFCHAHAAAFGETAYKSAYLLAHYPAHYLMGVMNNFPMAYYPLRTVVSEARRRGIKVLGPNINRSRTDDCANRTTIRSGLKHVHGMKERTLKAIEEERMKGRFLSVQDFCERVPVSRDEVESLALAGAFDELHGNRKAILRAAERLAHEGAARRAGASPLLSCTPLPAVRDFTPFEKALKELATLGFCAGPDPMSFHRGKLGVAGVMTAANALAAGDGARVIVAGWRTRAHTPPIKSGKTIVFFTLEDETDTMDVTVFPDTYDVYGRTIFAEPLVVVIGRMQNRDGALCLVAESVRPMRDVLAAARELEQALPAMADVSAAEVGWALAEW
jgi:DNA polymerase III alpha subunit